MVTFTDSDHVTTSRAVIQSPDHPAVFIMLDYKKPPVFCGLGGRDRELSALELAQYLLEWEMKREARK